MKLVGVENNIVNTNNSNSDFLIISDQPIKKYSYYFELEAMSTFGLFNAAAVAFVEKDENNEFIKDNTQRKSDTVTILQRTQYYEYYHEYTATMQYYQNSLNLELGGYESDYTMFNAKNKTVLTIIDDKNNFKSYTADRNSYYDDNTYYRLGLGIDLDLDKKSTTIRYYSNAYNYNTIDKNEKLLHQQISINRIFDPDKLYIVIYPQYLTVRHYCNRNHVADDIDTTTKQTSYANYKFFFNKDEIKYTHLYEKYNHPATVVEKLGGGVYGKMSDNNFQKLSDHKWDEISKDEKLSLLEQTKGLVPSIDQLKTLDQPIRVVTKAES